MNARRKFICEMPSMWNVQHLQHRRLLLETQCFCSSNFKFSISLSIFCRFSNMVHSCTSSVNLLFSDIVCLELSSENNLAFLSCDFLSTARFRCSRQANSRMAAPTNNKHTRMYSPSAEICRTDGDSAWKSSKNDEGCNYIRTLVDY